MVIRYIDYLCIGNRKGLLGFIPLLLFFRQNNVVISLARRCGELNTQK